MSTTNSNNASTPNVIRPQGGQAFTLNLLPTRGEKRLIPSPVTVSQATQIINQGFSKGQPVPINYPISVSTLQNDFNLSAALEPLTDFVAIYIQNRGVDNQGNPDPTSNAIFRFLINPSSINIAHSTLEGETFARAGWQFGVWGEDFVRISLSGKTPGQYFNLGTTDEFAEYSLSYRSLEQLQDVFENNGYWFEGESAGYGSTPANFTRQIVKMHQDVILLVKEFIWSGMFETFEWSQDANNPYLADFTLSFIAWKEQFRSDSPYINAISNTTQRGNAYSACTALTSPIQIPTQQTGANSGQPQTAVPAAPGNTTATSPAAQSEQVSLPTVNPLIMTNSPTQPIFNSITTYFNDWQGVL
jgi:hypothetical protein